MEFQHASSNNWRNWLNYYVYQAVPYDLNDLRDGKEDAWKAAFPMIPEK